MSRWSRPNTCSWSAIIVSLIGVLLAGCESHSSIRGTVTYDGQMVQQGWINFLPSDGKGPSQGAQITGGQYEVKEITPGKKTVQIIGVKEIVFAQSSAEMAQAAQEKKNRAPERADEIPPNAEGNNVEFEVPTGNSSHDFTLKRPAQGR